MEDQLISAVRQRGRVVFIAGRDKVTYTFNLGQGREIQLKQNSHFDRDDLQSLCRLVDRGLVQIAPLIRDVVPVSEAKRIYDTLRDTPDELLGRCLYGRRIWLPRLWRFMPLWLRYLRTGRPIIGVRSVQ